MLIATNIEKATTIGTAIKVIKTVLTVDFINISSLNKLI